MARTPFAPDRRGTAILEFAFVAPVLILLLFGLLQLAHVAFARSALESATMAGARYAAAQSCLSRRQSGMQQIIIDRMTQFQSFNGEAPAIKVLAYGSNFGDVGNPEPYTDTNRNHRHDANESYTDVNGNGGYDEDMGRDGSVGNAGDVVSLTTSFKLAPIVPFLSERLNDGLPFYTLSASTVVRNEPIFRDQCT